MDGGEGDLALTRAKRQALIPVNMEAIPDLFAAQQHMYTMACDGFHAPGPCPPSQAPVHVEFGS